MALLQIVYCEKNVQCLYTLLLHRHYNSAMLLKAAQVSCSIAILAIRKEGMNDPWLAIVSGSLPSRLLGTSGGLFCTLPGMCNYVCCTILNIYSIGYSWDNL